VARTKSILTEAKQIERAVTLINLGARLQVLESETDLSYERLLRLYKEVAGRSPSKGQLPFSTDWFMTWQPNIHASLFLNIHEYLNKVAALDEIDTVIKAYQLYLEQMQSEGLDPLLSVTRAWRLVKFVDNGMLTMTACSKCGGHFVTHPHEIARHYVCGLCNPPARAGTGKAAGALRIGVQAHGGRGGPWQHQPWRRSRTPAQVPRPGCRNPVCFLIVRLLLAQFSVLCAGPQRARFFCFSPGLVRPIASP
jgi:flagellar transcriptional activator FlhC